MSFFSLCTRSPKKLAFHPKRFSSNGWRLTRALRQVPSLPYYGTAGVPFPPFPVTAVFELSAAAACVLTSMN